MLCIIMCFFNFTFDCLWSKQVNPVSIEDIIEFAKKVLEARGYRLVQVEEAEAADQTVRDAEEAAAKEHEDVAVADLNESDAINALKEAANSYTKEG